MSNDEKEERRERRRRKRQQIMSEFWQMLQESTKESAEDVLRFWGWIILFVLLLTIMTPHN